ncbi:AAA family ATPase [Micromonospora chersina]|uniref:ATP-binding protein n=1 Tax=Micromonospora chersina TaxID=47854 RepID=UPI0037237105
MYTDFVGRTEELLAVERLLDADAGNAVVSVVGEPGIGKTRFLAEVTRRAAGRGWRVVRMGVELPSTSVPSGSDTCLSSDRALIVIDDAHLADQRAVELLHRYTYEPLAGRTILVTAYRPRQVPGRLVAALASAAGVGPVHRIELRGLPLHQARELIGRHIPAAAISCIYEDSAGNPLYLSVLSEQYTCGHSTREEAHLPGDGWAMLRVDVEALPAHRPPR